MYLEKIMSQKLINPGDRFVVGVSGGPDSMALLAFLLSLKNELKLALFVAHVNHHTRDAENDMEETLIRNYCEHHQLPFYVSHFHKSGTDNFHEEARNFRYQFFLDLARKVKANKIALAHHADDQVETILLKIMRGNQLGGYTGMKSSYDLDAGIEVVRPLLTLAKQDLIAYCDKADVPYALDSSNLSNKYTRNFLRNEIIPLLKEIQPDFNDKIIQLNEQLAEADAYLKENAKIRLSELIILTEKERIILDCDKLKTLPKALMRVSFLEVVKMLDIANLELSYAKVNALINIVHSDKPNLTYDLGKNVYCVKAYDRLTFQVGQKMSISYQFLLDEARDYALPNGMTLRVKKVQEITKTNNKKMFLCYNSTIWPLLIRTRVDGDYINTKIGRKKVNRVFIDAKIPVALRKVWPLLVDRNDNVLWVIGLQKCDYRNFPKGSDYLEIEILS